MKANRIKWEELWENNFGLYPDNTDEKDNPHGIYEVDGEKYYPVDYYDDISKENNINNKVSINKGNTQKEIECNLCEKSGCKITPNINNDDKNKDTFIHSMAFYKQPEGILFECDNGQGYTFVNQLDPSACQQQNLCISRTLGTIAIDTSCLKKPKTKVLFSCNIEFIPRASEAKAQLEFVLSRTCNNGPESNIGNWVYAVSTGIKENYQSFKFNFCSYSSLPGCYNYFVRVLPICIKNSCVCITNCNLEAVAQSA